MNLIALWLATWRLTSLILYEGGPLDVFRKLRHLVKADREGELSNFSVLFTCPWCLSVWVAGISYINSDRWLAHVRAVVVAALENTPHGVQRVERGPQFRAMPIRRIRVSHSSCCFDD